MNKLYKIIFVMISFFCMFSCSNGFELGDEIFKDIETFEPPVTDTDSTGKNILTKEFSYFNIPGAIEYPDDNSAYIHLDTRESELITLNLMLQLKGLIDSVDGNVKVTANYTSLEQGSEELVNRVLFDKYQHMVFSKNLGNTEYDPSTSNIEIELNTSSLPQLGLITFKFEYAQSVYAVATAPKEFQLYISSAEDYKPIFTVSEIVSKDNKVYVHDKNGQNLLLVDESLQASQQTFTSTYSMRLAGYNCQKPVNFDIISNTDGLVIDNVIHNDNNTIDFDVTYNQCSRKFDFTNDSFTVKLSSIPENGDYYKNAEVVTSVNAYRTPYLIYYSPEFSTSKYSDKKSEIIDEVEKYYTEITIPPQDKNSLLDATYIIYRKDDRNDSFYQIAEITSPVSNEIVYKDYDALMLRTEPTYKIIIIADNVKSLESKIITGTRMLTNYELALSIMESIRYGLIDKDLHNTGVSEENKSIANGTFTQKRTYWSSAVAYNHKYSLTNYKPNFVSLTGSFEYTADVAGYGDAGRNSIDTITSWWIHGKAPFTGTINFLSPYGDGSLIFNNVNIASNNWNSPSWKNGSITINVGNESETYSNSSQIPFGFYMDEKTFDKAIVGQGSDGKKKVYFSSFDSNKSAMYTYPLSTEDNWVIEINENEDSENSAKQDYTATLQMHFDGVYSKYPLSASIEGSDSGLSVSNLQYSTVENGQQIIYFDVTVVSEASLDFENPGSGVTVSVNGDSNIYSNTSMPLEVVLHGSRIEKRIPVVLDSIAEQVDSDIVSITNTSANAYKIAIKDSSIDTAQSSTFEVPVVLNFPDVRNGFDIDVSVKENSNNNVLAEITSIENGKVKLNLTHENAKEFEETLGSVTLVVNSEHTHIYEGLPLEITIDIERDRNLTSIYQNIFANSIKGKTYTYRGTVAGGSEILETYTVSADGKTITKTHTDWRDGKTSIVQTYTSSSATNQTTATYSNISVTYNSDTSITIGDKTVTTDFADPGPLFVDRVKNKTFKWRSTTAGSSEWLHVYNFDDDGNLTYNKQKWRNNFFEDTVTHDCTQDSFTTGSYNGTTYSLDGNKLKQTNTVVGEINFSDPGPKFVDRVKGQIFAGSGYKYEFSADGKSMNVSGGKWYVAGDEGQHTINVDKGNAAIYQKSDAFRWGFKLTSEKGRVDDTLCRNGASLANNGDVLMSDATHSPAYLDAEIELPPPSENDKIIQAYVDSFTTSKASQELSDGGKYYTEISITSFTEATEGNMLNYKLTRTDDAATDKILDSGTFDASKGFIFKDFNALILQSEPKYKLTIWGLEEGKEYVSEKTGSRMLTNRELALAVMVAIREGTRQTHSSKNETVNAGGGSFKHSREYHTTVSYGHTYSVKNYTPWFLTLSSGSFKYIADDESNTNINTVDKGSGLGKTAAPFTGTINFSSSYGSGSLTFNNVHINNNDKNNPSWKSGTLDVTVAGKKVAYSNDSGIPFGFYMDYNTFKGKIAPNGNYTQK